MCGFESIDEMVSSRVRPVKSAEGAKEGEMRGDLLMLVEAGRSRVFESLKPKGMRSRLGWRCESLARFFALRSETTSEVSVGSSGAETCRA